MLSVLLRFLDPMLRSTAGASAWQVRCVRWAAACRLGSQPVLSAQGLLPVSPAAHRA